MRRSRTSTVGLKHLPFFEAIGKAEENSTHARAATAGLLLLRLIDHWVLAGPVMVEPESVSVRSVRAAIMQLDAGDPSREVMLGLINTMQTIREVDLQPVLPRLFAYSGCLEKQLDLSLAADVYATIARLAEEEFDGDLLIDSYLRLGYCQRNLGGLSDAETSYATAGKIAKRRKEVARELRSRIGTAIVVMTRGNLPKADEMLAQVALDSERAVCADETARSLHARSVVAQRRGDLGRAVCHAYEALQSAVSANDRDLILADIGAYFIAMKRYDAARDALMILEATSVSETAKLNSRVNMLILAARAGDRDTFSRVQEQLDGVELTPEVRVNYLIERARGHRTFGEPELARTLLEEARSVALARGYNRSVFEADEMLAEREVVVHATSGEPEFVLSESAAGVEKELRRLALEVAA